RHTRRAAGPPGSARTGRALLRAPPAMPWLRGDPAADRTTAPGATAAVRRCWQTFVLPARLERLTCANLLSDSATPGQPLPRWVAPGEVFGSAHQAAESYRRGHRR